MPNTLDYVSHRTWGHDFTITTVDKKIHTISGMLWNGSGLKIGDYLILPNKDKSTRYRITECKQMFDPPDMYSFTAVFDPRIVGLNLA